MIYWRTSFVALLILILIGFSWQPVQGHGLGEQQLEQFPDGPFRISAWTDPISPSTDDQLHVTVAVENEDGLVREATVNVSAILTSDETVTLFDRATHEDAVNKLHYEAAFEFEEAGTYTILIRVENDEGTGEAAFDLAIVEGEGRDVPVGWLIAGGAGLLFLGFVVWNRYKLYRDEKV